MKVVEIKGLQREEGHIFYIRRYTGDVYVELPTSTEHTKINFVIEMDPLGNKTIDLQITPGINYPLVPLKRAIIEYILAQELEGKLPC